MDFSKIQLNYSEFEQIRMYENELANNSKQKLKKVLWQLLLLSHFDCAKNKLHGLLETKLYFCPRFAPLHGSFTLFFEFMWQISGILVFALTFAMTKTWYHTYLHLFIVYAELLSNLFF